MTTTQKILANQAPKAASKIPHSKSFIDYKQKTSSLQVYMQIVDAALTQATFKMKNAYKDKSAKTITEALGLPSDKYSRLSKSIGNFSRVVTETKAQQMEMIICRLYSLFTEYLKSIVKELYAQHPIETVGALCNQKEGKNITYFKILELGNYESLSTYMIETVFRDLSKDKQGTKELLDKIFKCAKISISNKEQEDALRFLEVRHLIIHNGSIIDDIYANKYGSLFRKQLKPGDNVPNNYDFIKTAIYKTYHLCDIIDRELIKHGLVNPYK